MGSQGSKGACEQYELSNQLCQRYDQFYTFLVHEAKYKADLVQPKTMETVARKYLTTLFEREVKNKENEDRGEGCNMVWRAASIARSECPICFTEYDSNERHAAVVKLRNCQHEVSCLSCFQQYVTNKCSEGDIVPWLRCPEKNCTEYVHPDDIWTSLHAERMEDLLRIAIVRERKYFASQPAWDECSKCSFGFLVKERRGNGRKADCAICGVTNPNVGAFKLDGELRKLIEDGKLRPCPKCKTHTMKEYGICNVIQCGTCNVWWNWKTGETGSSASDVKKKARLTGTLWEPGELEYQRNLEHTNLPEFKRLLASAGIKYNPNYVRGGS